MQSGLKDFAEYLLNYKYHLQLIKKGEFENVCKKIIDVCAS